MPKGLQPSRLKSGAANSTGGKAYRVANGYATALANGDPVSLSNGTVVRYSAGDKMLGVVTGFEWIDPTTRKPIYSTIFPAATSSAQEISGDNRPIAYVIDNPDQQFTIDAGASVAVTAGDIGKTFGLTLNAPDAGSRNSTVVLGSAVASVDQAAVRVVALEQTPGNAFGENGNTVEVVIVNHIYNV